jgi:hypothetical protein
MGKETFVVLKFPVTVEIQADGVVGQISIVGTGIDNPGVIGDTIEFYDTFQLGTAVVGQAALVP